MPRNSFKSSVVTVGYAVRAILKNPNIRILVSSETQKNAKKFVAEIRGHFESNQKLKALFGNYRGDRIWRDDEFLISKRTRVLKESTVTAASLEKMTVVGMHFDLIILDDPVSMRTVNNVDQIQHTLDHYKLLLSVLEPGLDKQIIVIGTRWSINDLYGWILDEGGSEREQYDIYVREAVDEDGNSLLPKILTPEFLDIVRKTQGEFIFACQYLNRPITSDIATFKQSHIKYYEKAPDNLIYFMTLDPAISTKSRADFTGIIVNGVDHENKWWIHEALQLRLDPSGIIDIVFELIDKYQPFMTLGMEKFALEKFLKISFISEMTKRNKAFPIKELETDNRVSKEVRIRSLQPKFESGEIMIRKEHEALYNQIVFHPQVKNDDVIDALKSQLAITFPAPFLPKTPAEKYSHLSEREKKLWLDVDKVAKKRSVLSRKGGFFDI